MKETSEKGVWSSNGKALTNAWLKTGLRSRGMTRDLVWGVKLPEELGEKWEKKVMYVWVSCSSIFLTYNVPLRREKLTFCFDGIV